MVEGTISLAVAIKDNRYIINVRPSDTVLKTIICFL